MSDTRQRRRRQQQQRQQQQRQQQIPSFSEETARKVHRELLRSHVLATAAKAEAESQASTTAALSASTPVARAATASEERIVSTSTLLVRALFHTEFALILAQDHRNREQPSLDLLLSERALLTKASLLRKLGLRRQSAAVEIAAAAQAEGLAVDRKLVGGAELEKVLELWVVASPDEEGEGRVIGVVAPHDGKEEISTTGNLQQLNCCATESRSMRRPLLAATAETPAHISDTEAAEPGAAADDQDVGEDENPYWGHIISQSWRRRGGRQIVR